MIKYKLRFLIILLLGIAIFTSCSNSNNNFNRDKEINAQMISKIHPILNIANNEVEYNNLITQKYSDEDLYECADYNYNIEDIDEECHIECLRKVNEKTYYAILKSINKMIVIILFEENEDNEFKAIKFSYMETLLSKETFENMKVGRNYEY